MATLEAPRSKDTKRRLGELALYIASKMEGNPTFGATKLNKVLFYCDFLWFKEHGRPITGATYQKLDHGPAPREWLPVLSWLEGEGAAKMEVRSYLGKSQKRLRPIRRADLQHFDPEEIALVDEVIESLSGVSAAALSEYTHQHLGWKLAEYGETIPYHTVHLSDKGALPSDVQRGIELAKQYGWLKSAGSAP
jgi:uncharacterized phage-associated protein